MKPSDDASPLRYSPNHSGFDEAFQEHPTMAAHWQQLLNLLGAHSNTQLQQRLTKLERILRDDGALIRTSKSTWPLNLAPWLIDSTQWHTIETGLCERAELLNKVFNDIYQDQRLIQEGVIPPEALFVDPGFLRPCFGINLGERPLSFYSADLIRNPNGQFQVLTDRTQGLNGVGFALENRSAMSRVFPSWFRHLPARDLSFFFQMMRYQLYHLSQSQERPNIVLLTSNSQNDYYFEHALLANYLGFTLVQGRDITVRNGYAWLKSLDGLSRVDTIIRHIDDVDCDPAELRGDSLWGIPGLLEVVRNQHVSVVNPLGSGALENPILMKYSDAISQFFTGRTLSLENVPSYWAGDPLDLEYILDNLPNLVIKPVSKEQPSTILGNSLDQEQIEQLRREIQARPLYYAAQEHVVPSTVPTWQDGSELLASASVLRTFAFASNNDYHVMPGGLARSSDQSGLIKFSTESSSKDVWVLSGNVNSQPIPEQESYSLIHANKSLPSRMVENMFWLGRYMARVEWSLRLLRTVFIQMNNARQLSDECYRHLLKAVTQFTNTLPGFSDEQPEYYEKADEELYAVMVDINKPGSLASNIREMLNCADEVQTLLSSDTQRVISDLRQEISDLATLLDDFSSAPEESLDPMVTSLLALAGLTQESMMRGHGWHFMKLGRLLESSEQTLSLLDALLVPVLNEYDEYVALETILLTGETLNTFRRQYGANNSIEHVLSLMLTAIDNPRSMVYLVQELQHLVETLPPKNSSLPTKGLSDRQRLIKIHHDIELADIEKLTTQNTSKTRDQLAELIDNCQTLLNSISESISRQYFDHTDTEQQAFDDPWNRRQ